MKVPSKRHGSGATGIETDMPSVFVAAATSGRKKGWFNALDLNITVITL
jgi:hypothetical protein